MNVVKRTSNKANKADDQIRLIIVVGLFLLLFLCITIMVIFHSIMNEWVSAIFGGLIGSLSTFLGIIIGFYWGTSSGSQKKDVMIAGKSH